MGSFNVREWAGYGIPKGPLAESAHRIRPLMIKTWLVVGALLGALFAADPISVARQDPAEPAVKRTAEELEVDGAHSSALFRVQHMGAAPFWGQFTEISGRLKIDDDHLDESFVRVEIPTESVETRAADRDRHLKGQDFFSAKEFPALTFESKKVEKAGKGRYRISGDLTLRGKTKAVTLDAEHTGTAEISPRFGLRSGYEATFEIDRTDYGINYGADNGALGKTVRIVIALECKRPS